MKRIALAGLAGLLAVGVGSAALAQSRPYPDENPNVAAERDYQDQRNVYDDQMDAYAQQRGDYADQRDAYDRKAQDYRVDRRVYENRMRAYERARADYDAEYGPGAYEYYYPEPTDPN